MRKTNWILFMVLCLLISLNILTRDAFAQMAYSSDKKASGFLIAKNKKAYTKSRGNLVKNAFPNAGMEEGKVGSITNWTREYPPACLKEYASIVDETEKHSGSRSLRLTVQKNDAMKVKMGPETFSLLPNRYYHLRLWIKAEPLYHFKVYLKEIDSEGKGFWRWIGPWVKVPPVWTEISIPFITSPNTRAGLLKFYMYGEPSPEEPRSYWIDDLELIDYGEPEKVDKIGPNLLTNPGFELVNPKTGFAIDWGGWFPAGKKLRTVTNATESHSGKRYMHAPLEKNERVILAGMRVPVRFPLRYRWSIWAKGTGKIILGLDRYERGGQRVGPVDIYPLKCGDYIPVTSEWKKYAIELSIDRPEIIWAIPIVDLMGKVSFDDMIFQEVP